MEKPLLLVIGHLIAQIIQDNSSAFDPVSEYFRVGKKDSLPYLRKILINPLINNRRLIKKLEFKYRGDIIKVTPQDIYKFIKSSKMDGDARKLLLYYAYYYLQKHNEEPGTLGDFLIKEKIAKEVSKGQGLKIGDKYYAYYG